MSLLEWIILGSIALIAIAACVFVNRLRKEGHSVPGKMCAGCPSHTSLEPQRTNDSPK